MIRAAHPAGRAAVGASPAYSFITTGRVFGVFSPAPAVSALWRA